MAACSSCYAEVGPEDVADEQLGVADLPEEIVADAHLAGGADEQVGVGHAGGVEVVGDRLFVDVARGGAASRRPSRAIVAHGVGDFGPAAVVEREHERQAVVVSGFFERDVHFFEHRVGEIFQPADLAEADVVLHHRRPFLLQVLDVHLHEERDFV